MKIGGLQKNSLIDYPGKISSVIFFSGCNFRCPYCHNPGLAVSSRRGGSISEKSIMSYLDRSKKFLDGVVISGGEPTLQSNLILFCEKIKNMGYQIKLDTNGSRPSVVKKLIDKDLVDYIAMDIKTNLFNYSALIRDHTGIWDIFKSSQIVKNSKINYEFRTTCVKPFVSNKNIKYILALIYGAKLYAFQRFRTAAVLEPKFFEDNNNICHEDEILQFKFIADKWVDRCIVR